MLQSKETLAGDIGKLGLPLDLFIELALSLKICFLLWSFRYSICALECIIIIL
jgi:hypothetical protein